MWIHYKSSLAYPNSQLFLSQKIWLNQLWNAKREAKYSQYFSTMRHRTEYPPQIHLYTYAYYCLLRIAFDVIYIDERVNESSSRSTQQRCKRLPSCPFWQWPVSENTHKKRTANGLCCGILCTRVCTMCIKYEATQAEKFGSRTPDAISQMCVGRICLMPPMCEWYFILCVPHIQRNDDGADSDVRRWRTATAVVASGDTTTSQQRCGHVAAFVAPPPKGQRTLRQPPETVSFLKMSMHICIIASTRSSRWPLRRSHDHTTLYGVLSLSIGSHCCIGMNLCFSPLKPRKGCGFKGEKHKFHTPRNEF